MKQDEVKYLEPELILKLRGGREQIVITEIPYQVNKSSLIEKITSRSHG